MPCFLLGKLDRVERGALASLKKKQVATLVHDTDCHTDVQFLGLRFCRGDHDLDMR